MDELLSNKPLLRTILSAEKAMACQKYADAVMLFSRALNSPGIKTLEKEKLASIYVNRGFAFRKIKEPHKALGDFKRASELNPSNANPHLNAGLVYGEDLALYNQSIAEFDMAIAINPVNAEALSSRGLAKTLSGDIEGGEEDIRRAYDVDPNNACAVANMGNVYLKAQDIESAANMYRRALEADPHDYISRLNLAIALDKMGMYDAVEGVLKKDKRAVQIWLSKGGRPLRGLSVWPLIAIAILVFVVILFFMGNF